MLGILASLMLAATPAPASQTAPDGTAGPPSKALAEGKPDPDYRACIDKVQKDLKAGREEAMKWAAMGGGPAAEHCLAVADLAAGYPKLAAIRLQTLADKSDAGEDLVRARIYSEAAQAWLEAGQNDAASDALEKAFKLAPGAGELYLVKAEIEFAKGRMQETIDAVTAAEDKGFDTAEAHILRGRALHNLARDREAADDVVAALKLDPLNIDALVLRGDLHRAGIDIKAHYERAPNQP